MLNKKRKNSSLEIFVGPEKGRLNIGIREII